MPYARFAVLPDSEIARVSFLKVQTWPGRADISKAVMTATRMETGSHFRQPPLARQRLKDDARYRTN